MKKESTTPVFNISANTILIWISIIATFVVAIIALVKQTPSTTSSSSGGDKCTCDYDDIASYLVTQKDFMQNYTEIKPSKITLQNSKEDEDNAFSIDHNNTDNSVTFNTQNKNIYFDGRMAKFQFNFSGTDTNPDIVRFYVDDGHYWYYSYNNTSGTINQ